MIKAYFCFIEDPAKYDGEGLNHLGQPIYYNGAQPLLIDNTNNHLLLKESADVARFVTNFPGRVIKNIKIEKGADEFLIYSANASHISQGWLGLTIIDATKESMPINSELDLSSKLYNQVGHCVENNCPVDFSYIEELFREYKLDLNKNIHERIIKKGGKYSLENTVTPNDDYMTKWDFFVINKYGMPITDIIRCQSNKQGDNVFVMNMKQEINLPGIKDLNTLHLMNCPQIALCYDTCKKLGERAGYNDFTLRHLSSHLPNAKGFEFAFIDKLLIEEIELLMVLDIKNKKLTDDKYIDKLYGNEREALSALKNNVIKHCDYNTASIIKWSQMNGNEIEMPLVQDFFFNNFKAVVEEKSLFKSKKKR
ncbi:MAG: hypothetical protein WC307_02550 [Candidatus Nanoarchaeia archaeon]|jgi:hypothetical protein